MYPWMVNDHQGWKMHLHAAQAGFAKWHLGPISGMFSLSFLAIDYLDDLLMKLSARWGPALLIVLAIMCICVLVAPAVEKKLGWGWIPLCAFLLIFGHPLLTNFGSLVRLAFLVSVGWGGTGRQDASSR